MRRSTRCQRRRVPASPDSNRRNFRSLTALSPSRRRSRARPSAALPHEPPSFESRRRPRPAGTPLSPTGWSSAKTLRCEIRGSGKSLHRRWISQSPLSQVHQSLQENPVRRKREHLSVHHQPRPIPGRSAPASRVQRRAVCRPEKRLRRSVHRRVRSSAKESRPRIDFSRSIRTRRNAQCPVPLQRQFDPPALALPRRPVTRVERPKLRTSPPAGCASTGQFPATRAVDRCRSAARSQRRARRRRGSRSRSRSHTTQHPLRRRCRNPAAKSAPESLSRGPADQSAARRS